MSSAAPPRPNPRFVGAPGKILRPQPSTRRQRAVSSTMYPRGATRLLPFGYGIAFIRPVRSKILGDMEHFDVCEPHCAQRVVSRLGVGTVVPGATPAINDDEFCPRQRFDSLAQLLQTARAGGRTDVLRIRNVRLLKQSMKAHLNDQRFFTPG